MRRCLVRTNPANMPVNLLPFGLVAFYSQVKNHFPCITKSKTGRRRKELLFVIVEAALRFVLKRRRYGGVL